MKNPRLWQRLGIVGLTIALYFLVITFVPYRLGRVRYFISATERAAMKPLLGEYFYGSSRGMDYSLTLCENGSYRILFSGCGNTYAGESGAARLQGDRLTLYPISASFTDHHEYQVVYWEKRRYLIPLEQGVDFCMRINTEEEPRQDLTGDFYLHVGDEKQPALGKPEIPARWQPYLQPRPTIESLIRR